MTRNPLAAVLVALSLAIACGDDSSSDDAAVRPDSATDASTDSATDTSADSATDAMRSDAGPFDSGFPCRVCGDDVRAASCSRDDVAAAIAMATAGDRVLIPEGRCNWTSGLDLDVGIVVEGEGTVELVHDAGSDTLFRVTESATHLIEIANLSFEEGSGGAEAWDGMFINVGGDGLPVLVGGNTFTFTNGQRRAIRWNATGGVIFDNTFAAGGADANAIAILGPDSSWSTPHTMGTADVTGEANLYIEDNLFERFAAQALDPDSNSRVVIRNNTFDHAAMASHGADTSEDGTRHWELYDNTFLFVDHGDCDGSMTANLPYLFYIRGGTGVIADNVIPDVASCAWSDKAEIFMTVQNIRRNAGPYACWDTYPAPRQVGQGHDGSDFITDPVYLWGNSGGGNYDDPAVADYDPDECGGDLSTADFIQAGRDFIVGTPRPGYAKYPYPHPAR